MSDLAIRVENPSKLYCIGLRERYKALRDPLTGAMYAPFRALAYVLNGRWSAVGRQRSITDLYRGKSNGGQRSVVGGPY